MLKTEVYLTVLNTLIVVGSKNNWRTLNRLEMRVYNAMKLFLNFALDNVIATRALDVCFRLVIESCINFSALVLQCVCNPVLAHTVFKRCIGALSFALQCGLTNLRYYNTWAARVRTVR